MFDFVLSEWISLPVLPIGVAGGTVVAWNHDFYIIGG